MELPAGNLIILLLLKSATNKLLVLSTKIPSGIFNLVEELPALLIVPATTVALAVLPAGVLYTTCS